MKWRIVPPTVFRPMLKVYGVSVLGGSVFAALFMFISHSRGRENIAALLATVWLAIGLLVSGYFYAQGLAATGSKRWAINLFLTVLVLAPAISLSVFPLWGPVVLAVLFLLFILCVREKRTEEHAR